jgi:hypothetical protein
MKLPIGEEPSKEGPMTSPFTGMFGMTPYVPDTPSQTFSFSRDTHSTGGVPISFGRTAFFVALSHIDSKHQRRL